ncbi:MAG: glycosyltransferase [Chloroflexota bacterium]|nr:glycosyltransferase [Chloroflexota bacterium]
MQTRMTPDNTEFVILCFEGPDRYSLAGGLGVRISTLSATLVRMGFRTHHFFIGDPTLPGAEERWGGRLVLRRWCQWISEYHRGGVYEGEEDKIRDYSMSIPGIVRDEIVMPATRKGKTVVVLGEEWQTAQSVCQLSEVLSSGGLRDRVVMFWNANNTYGFDRIDWRQLDRSATITTVSRYMKHIMWGMGLNPLVIPNGIPRTLFGKTDEAKVQALRKALGGDLILFKVARWDPDKGWNQAVEAAAHLKRDSGVRSVLVARGGTEPYGREVRSNARSMGLAVTATKPDCDSFDHCLAEVGKAAAADVIDIRSHMPLELLKVFYRASSAVLANSSHEPFGLVGLEAMAAGGVAFTGCTGEDYAIPFVNAVVLETNSSSEIAEYVSYLWEHPEEDVRIRKAARRTARDFTWEAATRNLLSKLENQARIQGVLAGRAHPSPLPRFDIDRTKPAKGKGAIRTPRTVSRGLRPPPRTRKPRDGDR